MRVRFNDFRNNENWYHIISDQYEEILHLSLSERVQWIQDEWRCVIKYEWEDSTRTVVFEFTEEDYLIAVLKYGPPELDDNKV